MRKVLICNLLLAFIITGCASIMQGTTQSIGIGSTPLGATVSIDNSETGKTPLVVQLSRKDNHTVLIAFFHLFRYFVHGQFLLFLGFPTDYSSRH